MPSAGCVASTNAFSALVGWWDASDGTTVLNSLGAAAAGGSAVQTLTDKSTFGLGGSMAQATAGFQGTYSTGASGINNLGAISLTNASNTSYTNSSSTINNLINGSNVRYTVISVTKHTSFAGAAKNIWVWSNTVSGSNLVLTGPTSTPNFQWFRRDGGSSSTSMTTGTPATATTYVIVHSFDGTNVQFRVNKGVTLSNTTAGNTAGTISNNEFCFGSRFPSQPSTDGMSGLLGEVWLFKTNLMNSSTDLSKIQQIETYLGSKWGAF